MELASVSASPIPYFFMKYDISTNTQCRGQCRLRKASILGASILPLDRSVVAFYLFSSRCVSDRRDKCSLESFLIVGFRLRWNIRLAAHGETSVQIPLIYGLILTLQITIEWFGMSRSLTWS